MLFKPAFRLLFTTGLCLLTFSTTAYPQQADYAKYKKLIAEHTSRDFKKVYREAGQAMPYPFLTPGTIAYSDALWDWDSWLFNIALRQLLADRNNKQEQEQAVNYERGCVLNFLAYSGPDGWCPIVIERDPTHLFSKKPDNIFTENMHKPVLAQHAAFLTQLDNGNAEWLRDKFANMQFFIQGYKTRYYHKLTGLYFWQNDVMIGVDNDPCTYYRPDRSSGSILLNCFMYKELRAMSYLAGQLGLNEIKSDYDRDAEKLRDAIQEHCWDERDGFFYSVDLNLKPVNTDKWGYHIGAQRHWECLIQRIGVWSGFLAMWAGIATPEQAQRMVVEHYENERTFNAPYGVRTLSKMEKMYNVKASSNPSSWLGPLWGISNYMTWRGLVDYGFTEQAQELAQKTIALFGRDYEKTGTLHEYYQPENGEPIVNAGFQNWNYLVLNMMAWIDGRPVIREF